MKNIFYLILELNINKKKSLVLNIFSLLVINKFHASQILVYFKINKNFFHKYIKLK